MRKLAQAAGVAVASLGMVLVFGTGAYAGSDGPTVCNSGPQSTCVWFTNNGDVIHVKDTDCDGHAAVAQVEVPYNGIYQNLWNTDGCGTTDTWSYGTAVTEGARVYYKGCYGVYSTGYITRCSGIGSGVA